jgi:hypothetical protein
LSGVVWCPSQKVRYTSHPYYPNSQGEVYPVDCEIPLSLSVFPLVEVFA